LELYEKDSLVALEGNEKAATQPHEVARRISEHRGNSGRALLARLEESVITVGAQCARDKREGFRSRLETTGIIEDIMSNVAKVIDCVDYTVALVGHQNLTAKGPEARAPVSRIWCRRYNWSFNLVARARRVNLRNTSMPVNLKDVAVLARCDHVVLKCAHFVERNPGVVRVGARELRKEREETGWRGPKDATTKCDEDVARGEHGRDRRGLNWRYSNVFFRGRGRLVQRGNPRAVERIDVCIGGGESGRKQFSL
jgi:hypothetical protein